jgi:hypothetical protein
MTGANIKIILTCSFIPTIVVARDEKQFHHKKIFLYSFSLKKATISEYCFTNFVVE